jgi:hypothetical protein
MSEDEQADDNPYRSPTGGPSPTNVFGLSEPIHGEGVVSPEEVRQALKGSGSRPSVLWIPLLILGLVLYASKGVSGISYVLILCFALGGLGLLVLLAVVVLRQQKRKEMKDAESNTVPVRITINEDTVSTATDTGSNQFTWDNFSGYHRAENIMMLFIRFSGMAVIVPRSFFADDSQWETCVAIVQCKLPEQEPGKAATSAVKVTAGERDTSRTQRLKTHGAFDKAPAGALVFEGRLSPGDLSRAMRLVEGLSMRRVVAFLFLGVFLASGMAVFASGTCDWPILMPIGLGVLVILLIFLLIPRWKTRRLLRRRQGIFAPQRWVVSEHGLERTMPTSTLTQQWSEISKYTIGEGLLILHITDLQVHILPRTFFQTSGDWEALLDIVKRKVGAAPEKSSGNG